MHQPLKHWMTYILPLLGFLGSWHSSVHETTDIYSIICITLSVLNRVYKVSIHLFKKLHGKSASYKNAHSKVDCFNSLGTSRFRGLTSTFQFQAH